MEITEITSPAWITAAGTVAGYLILLGIMTVVLFGVPTLLFMFL